MYATIICYVIAGSIFGLINFPSSILIQAGGYNQQAGRKPGVDMLSLISPVFI